MRQKKPSICRWLCRSWRVLIACGIAGGCLACFRPRRQETKTTFRVWLPCCTTVHPCRRCYPSRPSNLSPQRCNKNATWEAVCCRYMHHGPRGYAVWEHPRVLCDTGALNINANARELMSVVNVFQWDFRRWACICTATYALLCFPPALAKFP